MNRIFCATALKARLAASDIVICSLGSANRSWRAVDAPQATYFCSDPMGLSVTIALGVALSSPDRSVVALCGDGDLAMSLSALATVCGAAPSNLRILVLNNARYETGGGQPLASPELRFDSVARAVGFANAGAAESEGELADALDRLFASPGPGLLSVAIDAEPLGYAPPADISQAEERAWFMRKLAETRP